MNVFTEIRRILPTYAKEGIIVLTGDVVAKFFTLAISIALISLITPYEYSFFGAFITLVAIVNQFSDSGLNQTFIRFYARHHAEEPERAAAYLVLVYRIKWIVMPAAAVLLFAVSAPLSLHFFHTDQLIEPFRLLALGLFGSGFIEFCASLFQARQAYGKLSTLRIVDALSKILYLIVVGLLGRFSLMHVYIAYTIVPFALGIATLIWSRSYYAPVDFDWRILWRELFQFGKWIAVTSFATMFLMKLDMLLVQFLLPHDKTDVGLYSAANRLCQVLAVFAGSIATLLYPKAMALRSLEEMKRYIRQTLTITVPMILLSLLYGAVLYFALPHFAPGYGPSYPTFLILMVGWIFTIVANPMTMLILTIGRSHVIAAISVAQLVVTILTHTVFIMWLGSIGAAISSVLTWFAAGAVSLAYLYRNRHALDTGH